MTAFAGSRALVLFSGGQDSTTCLAWALTRFSEVETVGFDYGQRHRVELDVRPRIRDAVSELRLGSSRLGPDHLLPIPALGAISETALTREVEIEIGESGLPTTFVPGRNLVFLSFAAALAYRRDCRHLVLGVCETDDAGYPDCRDDTIKAMQVALHLGLASRITLQTPLMWRSKAEIFALADEIGGEALVTLIVEHSHTCYLGDRTRRHEWGYGCGACPACRLRREGWETWRDARHPGADESVKHDE